MGAFVCLALTFLVALTGCADAAPSPLPPTLPPPVPLAERQIEIIDMPGDPDWLVAGFGSMWVKRDDGNVVRIDPATHELLATIDADITNPGLCQGIGSDGTSIWACSGPDIVRIDPATNAVVDVVEAHKIYVQGRLVSADGRVWILNGENGDRLVGVDVATHEIGAPIALDAACYDLAVGDASVWAACPMSNLVLRVDPATGTVTARIEVESPYTVTVGPDSAWAATTAGIARIDLDDHAVRSIPLDSAPGGDAGIWADATSVWVRTPDVFLFRVDSATLQIVEVISDPELGGGDVAGLDGSLWTSDFINGRVIHLRVDVP
jgi:streptogramin lyase